MELTVKELAQMSGVSVRTLHHYDHIGLLLPARVGQNGYRFYSRDEVLRLQQILLYREMGMALAQIGETLDRKDFDLVRALRDHRQQLENAKNRYGELIETIDATLMELEEKVEMNSNPFQGFSPEKQIAYEQELTDQFGTFAQSRIAESKAKVGKMSAERMEALKQEGHQINLDLVALLEKGMDAQTDDVQAIIARHYAWLKNYWTPDAQSYAGLGQYYIEHADFNAFYAKYHEDLAGFLAQGMAHFADQNLD